MLAEKLAELLDSDFYTGIPDSQLRAFCDYLMDKYGINPQHHIIAANEGNATAIAAGYHLATRKIPVVYMQNSGEGNMINPIASLLNEQVYAIPVIFIIGWRGEPGIHDEPQHIFQGQVTLKLLEDMNIPSFVIGSETTDNDVKIAMESFQIPLAAGKSVAFVIQKMRFPTMEKRIIEMSIRYHGRRVYDKLSMPPEKTRLSPQQGKRVGNSLKSVKQTDKVTNTIC